MKTIVIDPRAPSSEPGWTGGRKPSPGGPQPMPATRRDEALDLEINRQINRDGGDYQITPSNGGRM